MTARTKRSLAFFLGAVALFTLAAWWRWPDSVHVMGTIRRGGGTVRHPVVLQAGPERYELVATATVVPPWRGDARVSVEGDLPLDWSMHLSRPVLDLGLHRWPRLEGDVILGLEPKDRVAVWISIRPKPGKDPVCGMACDVTSLREAGQCFCSTGCRERWRAANPQAGAAAGPSLRLAFRDAATGAPLLTVPISFGAKGGDAHAHH